MVCHQVIVDAIFNHFGKGILAGTTIIGVWETKEQFEAWKALAPGDQGTIKVVFVASDIFVPDLIISMDKVGVGLAISKERDYADMVMLYCIEKPPFVEPDQSAKAVPK